MHKTTGLFPRLGLMMVLEFLVFGSWYPTIGLVLNENGLGDLIGLVFVFSSVAAVASPMFIGALADRFFPAQKVFGVLHLAGAVLLTCIPSAISSGNSALFLILLFAFTIFFQPTQAMPNNIAFVHLGDRHDVFPYIRSLGTASWIVAGLVVGQAGLSASTVIFYLTAGWSLILGMYAFTLPSTPPQQRDAKFRIGDMIGSGAFTLFRRRNFRVLMVCMLLISVPISIYNAYGSTYLSAAGIKDVASVMSLGQGCELVFILVLPAMLRTIGYRGVLITGLICWMVRCGLFLAMGGGPYWLAFVVVGMHGACNDFFMITACMYVDRMVPPALTAQAQSLVFFMSIGVGQGLGALLAGALYNNVVGASTSPSLTDWNILWTVAGAVSVAAFLLFLALFRKEHPLPPSSATPRNEPREQSGEQPSEERSGQLGGPGEPAGPGGPEGPGGSGAPAERIHTDRPRRRGHGPRPRRLVQTAEPAAPARARDSGRAEPE